MEKYDLIIKYLNLEKDNPLGASCFAPLIVMINQDKEIVKELLDKDFIHRNNLISFLDYGLCSLIKEDRNNKEYSLDLIYNNIIYVLTIFNDLENKWSISGEDFIKYLKGGVENV